MVYNTLNYQTKLALLEWGAVQSGPKKIIQSLQRDIDCYFHKIGGYLIHHIEDCRDVGIGVDFLCSPLQITGKKRIYKSGRWIYLTDVDLENEYIDEFNKEKERRAEINENIWDDLPHDFYALDGSKGEFMIRTKKTVGKERSIAQKTKGRVCKTYDKQNIIQWLLDLNWKPSKLSNSNINDIIGTIGANEPGKIVYDKGGWTNDQIRTIHYLMTKKDNVLCQILKEWYNKPENKRWYNPIDPRLCWLKMK